MKTRKQENKKYRRRKKEKEEKEAGRQAGRQASSQLVSSSVRIIESKVKTEGGFIVCFLRIQIVPNPHPSVEGTGQTDDP